MNWRKETENLKGFRLIPRIPVNMPMKMQIGKKWLPAKMVDITHKGLGIKVVQEIELGINMPIKFKVPWSHTPVKLTGRIVWMKKSTDYSCRFGLQIHKISTVDQKKLHEFVFFLQIGTFDLPCQSSQLN